MAAHILLSLYFFAYAIVALKPRLRQRRRHGRPAHGRLRMVEDILDRDADAYYAEWQQAQIGELNREMAHTSTHWLGPAPRSITRSTGCIWGSSFCWL
jgi:hypothetical protein